MPNCWAPSTYIVDGPCQDSIRTREAARKGGHRLSNQSHSQIFFQPGQQTRNQGSPGDALPVVLCMKCGHASYERTLEEKKKREKGGKDEGTGKESSCSSSAWASASCLLPFPQLHGCGARREGRPGPTWSVKLTATVSGLSPRNQGRGYGAVFLYRCTSALLFIICANHEQLEYLVATLFITPSEYLRHTDVQITDYTRADRR